MLKSGLKVQNVNPNFWEEAINPSFLYKNCYMLSTACKVKRKTSILSELVVLLQFRLRKRQAARMWKAPDQLVQAVLCTNFCSLPSLLLPGQEVSLVHGLLSAKDTSDCSYSRVLFLCSCVFLSAITMTHKHTQPLCCNPEVNNTL